MDLYEELVRPNRRSARSKNKRKSSQLHYVLEHERQFGDFQCQHCLRPVSAEPLRSGVNNRNHCPYCLWSKHVDLHQSGDRLAACKGPMQPVGLTFKQRQKKYASRQPGELMLVHQCARCGALSINRVAADDSPALLWDVFEASLALAPSLRALAAADGIDLLDGGARELLRERVLGRDG